MTVRTAVRDLCWSQNQVSNIILATAGALGLALLSQVRIHIPGDPVPVTLQVLAVILLGGLLGPRLAVAAVAEYLLFGLCGLPVFTGLAGGLGTLLGATGGYLFGFLPAAMVCGAIYQRVAGQGYARRVTGAAVAGLIGVGIIYLAGWLWLACWGHIGLIKAFELGVVPFIVADILKVSAAATALALRRKGAA